MKVLYVTSNGSIHDYRFLKKLVQDYTVLLLHYAAGTLIPEIKNLPGLEIITKKPPVRSFALAGELGHFKKVIRSFKPDIIHTGYLWQVGVLAAYAGVHPHLSMPWGSDVLIEPEKNPFLKMLARKVLSTADHIQCDAEYVKEKIISGYSVPADKITVFPWGIDLSLFKRLDSEECREEMGIPQDVFVVVFSRPLEQIYDLSTLITGFYDFSKDKNDVLLIIANYGSLLPEVEKKIENMGLNSKVKLAGWMPNSQIPLLFNASDVYVSTSISDGTSLSLLEAMACGKGIVITGIPSNTEWVNGRNGILVKTKNPAELSAGLNKYYNNRELIKSHGEINVQIAKECADWDKNYLKLKEIYSMLTG